MVVLIAASGAEMKDLLSIVAEFYLLRNLTQGRKLSMPVPYDNNHLICLETAKEEVDKIVVTDASLLFPPGQLALAALRHANEIPREHAHTPKFHSQQHRAHSASECDSSVRTYKFPSEKDIKHINRKLRSCWGLSSHDDSKKRDKKSKHKSKWSAG
ncbi:cyclin-H1-1-like isoform X2 [Eucalyptus grandis]|uniref:cyclin-H1-1-like isoform X2 n=1 Tax=Eucalyptus grandis TaxID=71139 RepID=UPI00192E945D|nr:cyclin-H1-1-like isoform X2 [Eucalyptus grandis]